MESRILKVQPLTKEAFKPFGFVLMRDPGVPPFQPDPPQFSDRMPFEVDDGEAEFVYALLKRKEFAFTALERHVKVTQGFFPLFGGPAIITVAPATDNNNLESLPPPESVKAFLLESYTAFVLHRGVWHGTILPLEESFGYILATRKATTDESIAPLYDGDVQIRNLGVKFELLL